MRDTYRCVQRQQEAVVEKFEGREDGRLSAELWPADTVLVRRDKLDVKGGPVKFQARVYPNVYKVTKKVSTHTHVPCCRCCGHLHAERLVTLDLPELELNADQPRKIEMKETAYDTLQQYHIAKFAVDGRATKMAGPQ